MRCRKVSWSHERQAVLAFVSDELMRSLIVIDESHEIAPHDFLIHISNPGHHLISFPRLEREVIAQPGTWKIVLRGHSQQICQRYVVPDNPGLGKVIHSQRLDESEIPGLILVPQPGRDRPMPGQQRTSLIERK